MTVTSRDTKTVFFEALEQETPDDLRRFLDAACGDDDQLRGRVETLLEAHLNAGQFLGGTAPADPIVNHPVIEKPGDTIGHYRLREQIGEGGMGLVFVAEQTEPVHRQVALKVCKPGMDTKEVLARFEVERQALALMDHPNIAKVLDAGTTESGRPYFVMELVRGIPFTEYCERGDCTTNERLQLFITVCQAVQHAHLKGIIHRDIKPSNVMVTLHDGVPVPKVIDFGVAKALNQRLTEQSVYTQHQQLIGTPLYMSPEQAEFSGLDIDTRTDVYSLGVLLYELLTGCTPFDRQILREQGFEEFRRQLREKDPLRPSDRISTLAAAAQSTLALQRGIDPRQLCQSLKGELDWIVMKALEKDRDRRYESASAFAADIQSYLDDEPVSACPPSMNYRLLKFARRNKTVLITTALIATSLVIGTAVSIFLAIDATKAHQLANRRLTAEQQARKRMKAALEREWETNQRVYPMNIASASRLLVSGSVEAAANVLSLQIPTTGGRIAVDLLGIISGVCVSVVDNLYWGTLHRCTA